jgi:isoquinoline 1-oxidoreductase subunit beta
VHVFEADLQHHAMDLIANRNGGAIVVDVPGVDATFRTAKMQFSLEPINGLAFEKDGVFEVHTGRARGS